MGLTPEQRALREAVRDVLRRHRTTPGSADADPSHARRLWTSLCEVGVAGLAIPEHFGGAGAGPTETAIAAEELGRVLAPVPLLGSAVLAAQAILATGDADACGRLLPRIASGEAVAALAWAGQAGGWNPAEAACRVTERAGGRWKLTGEAHYVLDGDVADVLIVAARMPGGGTGLFEVGPGQPGVGLRAATTMDQTRRLAVIHLGDADGRPLGVPGPGPADHPDHPDHPALARARDLACIALAAEQAGAAARALELTVEYTSTRIQFGRPIASFQAVGHRLAELHVLVESARVLAYRAAEVAASALSGSATPDPAVPGLALPGLALPGPAMPGSAMPGSAMPGSAAELPLVAAAAKAYCSEALAIVAGEMIQLHGAIGITWEHDAHRYFKRAHGTARILGGPSAHLARIAATVIDRE